ncbi:hypothetical protein C8F01DRAFT_1253452 [Mycena amicta]|nr:hypothetical protein C8F01DRAFT_1253452 [Mycena amicta]
MPHSRLIWTTARTSQALPTPSPPLILPKRPTNTVDGAHLLLSSYDPAAKGTTPGMRPAKQLLHYSLAEDPWNTYVSHKTARSLRRFIRPSANTDILTAADSTLKLPSTLRRSRLEEMLEACMMSTTGVHGLLGADVVAERNVIAQLMLPYKASFNASFINGVLFLEEHIPVEERHKIPKEKIVRSTGFLRACTEMHFPNFTEPHTRTRHTFHTVVSRSLGGLNLLMSGRVDCVTPTYNHHPSCYVQLMTSRFRYGDDTSAMFPAHTNPSRRQLYFLRAYLSDTPTTVLGLIDHSDILRSTRSLPTSSMLETAQGHPGKYQWNLESATRFAARTLIALRDLCQETADGIALTRTVGGRRAHVTGRGDALGDVWRVELLPAGDGEVEVFVRRLAKGKEGISEEEEGLKLPAGGCGIVPAKVVTMYGHTEP